MSSRDFDPDHIHLYSDTMHSVHIPRKSRTLSLTPPTVIDYPRTSWLDDERAVIRYTLTELRCDERVNINGYRIQRTEAFSRVSFHINEERSPKGHLKRYTLEETIERVTT